MSEASTPGASNTNPFVAIGELRFDGPLTDAQHLDVIDSAIGESPIVEDCELGLEYARTHIADQQTLVAAQLLVGERALTDPMSERPSLTQVRGINVLKKHRKIVDTAILGVQAFLELKDPVDAELAPQAFGVVRRLQDTHISNYTASEEEATSRFDQIHELATTFIDRAAAPGGMLPAEYLLGGELRDIYVDQLRWVNTQANMSRNVDDERIQEVREELFDSILDSVDVEMPDAVEFCLDLDKFDIIGLSKAKLLERALDLTKASSREPVPEEQRSWFGVKKETLKPSPFLERRYQLGRYVRKHFIEHLENSPELIAEVAGLFDVEDQAGMWEYYAEQLARYPFTPGEEGYDLGIIRQMPGLLGKLAEIAPADMVEQARQLVRDGLENATAQKMREPVIK